MRRLKPPTLEQWGCAHRWKEQSSKPQGDKLHRLRYYFCQRCGLRVKTREAPEVPWDEGDLVALVQALFPEGRSVSLGELGVVELWVDRLNALLARQGWVIHAIVERKNKHRRATAKGKERRPPEARFERRQIARSEQSGTTRSSDSEEVGLSKEGPYRRNGKEDPNGGV
jgi:hypothetical protein